MVDMKASSRITRDMASASRKITMVVIMKGNTSMISFMAEAPSHGLMALNTRANTFKIKE